MGASCLPWARWLILSALLVVLLACPHDDAPGSSDEVGDGDGDLGSLADPGAQDPPPVDPLGGGASLGCELPAGASWSAWKPPAALGNGLVHDSRLGASTQIHATTKQTALLGGVPWSTFVDHYEAMTRVGFRPAQLRAEIAVAPIWQHSSQIEIVDRSIYVSDDDANFKTEIETYLFADLAAEQAMSDFAPAQLGARPTSIETFTVSGGGDIELGYSLAWVHAADGLPWLLRVGMSKPAMIDEIDELGASGYRPISVSSRAREGQTDYAAIFVDDGMPEDSWAASLGLGAEFLDEEIQAIAGEGLYPFRITSERGAGNRVNVLWTRHPPGLAVEVRSNLTLATFEAEDAIMRTQGYHLETLDRYEDTGARYVAVWVSYQPCLRWTGTAFSDSDLEYLARYQMFHEQAIATMDFAGTNLEGRLLRPSGTLHILEGEELVLSRAYTFAPAIYPDTPINAPMRLASVSKSITAAAVVALMAEHGLPLTTPFVSAAGIPDAPAGMADVTVLDALRNLGGFRAEFGVYPSLGGNPQSYINHTIVDESPYGSIPIDGQEMFDYVVKEGHLGTNNAESYWDLARYQDSMMNGTLHYSNPGFSMLGEIVSGLGGVVYEKYVIESLAAPLGLQQQIFADPGHRKDARGPTLAGERAYLVNEDHPYRTLLERQDAPAQLPLFGVEPLPSVDGDSSMSWGINTGPLDPSAPNFASVGRYSGEAYLGGAPLAAGGWYADGQSLAKLIRALNQTNELMAPAVANQLWDPQWKNYNSWRSDGWSYGLGCYIRGNWVAWAGGMTGAMATIVHNRTHDFTVVHLVNAIGNGLDEFMNPLMTSPSLVWGASEIGQIFPCQDEVDTPDDECSAPFAAVPY